LLLLPAMSLSALETVPPIAPASPLAPPKVLSPPRAVPRKKRWWPYLVLGLVLAAGTAAVVWYLRSRPPAPAFRTVEVTRADITQRVTATGTLQPIITSPVGAQVSGIVWKLHADYNSEVKTGQLLVELDPALFNNAVALATTQLQAAQASLASNQALALGTKVVHERALDLQGQALVAQSELDAATAAWGQSTAQVRTSAAQVAQARVQLARANLDLEHSVIRSPVDGSVISRNIDVGQAVAATLTAPTLFTIAQDLHHMQVHAAVDEADIGDVHPGQAATFTVDAFRDATFPATVKEVRNAPQTASNVVTYDVVLDVENPEVKLRPGMTANVLILIVQKTQVVAVSNEALRFRPTAPTGSASSASKAATGAGVYVEVNASAVRVPVKLGVTDGNVTEVLEGLEPGRRVIIDALKNRAKGASGGAAHGS
jgi:HlyD family secretion protein